MTFFSLIPESNKYWNKVYSICLFLYAIKSYPWFRLVRPAEHRRVQVAGGRRHRGGHGTPRRGSQPRHHAAHAALPLHLLHWDGVRQQSVCHPLFFHNIIFCANYDIKLSFLVWHLQRDPVFVDSELPEGVDTRGAIPQGLYRDIQLAGGGAAAHSCEVTLYLQLERPQQSVSRDLDDGPALCQGLNPPGNNLIPFV